MIGNRKGFKYVINDKNITTDSIPYDHIDEPKKSNKRRSLPTNSKNNKTISNDTERINTSNEISSNKKRKTNNNNIYNIVDKTNDISDNTSNNQVDNNKNVVNNKSKVYYPNISYQYNNKPYNKTHSEIFDKLISDITSTEISELINFFDTNLKNKSYINDTLVDILDELTNEITNQCKTKAFLFQPEIKKNEKLIFTNLQDKLNSFTNYYDLILKYEEDLSLLGRDYDLWITGIPENQIIKNTFEIDPTAVTESKYNEHLHEIEQACDLILNEINLIENDLNESKKSQELLYSTYKKLNNKGDDAKALLKQFKKIF